MFLVIEVSTLENLPNKIGFFNKGNNNSFVLSNVVIRSTLIFYV